MFKLLYVPSLHPTQEQDDCTTWATLGIQFFSTGYLRNSYLIGDMPYIDVPLRNLRAICKAGLWHDDKPGTPIHKKNIDFTGKCGYNVWKFSEEFLSNFDVILCCHLPFTILLNLEVLKKQNKVIIIKTFGMQYPRWESIYAKLREEDVLIVRNSPAEQYYVQNYCGHDAIIRGSCVIDDTKWIGGVQKCVTFTSNFNIADKMSIRRKMLYENIKRLVKYPMELYGAANDNVKYSSGFASYYNKIRMLKTYDVNLVTGTPNANNTFSAVESLIVGQPSVIFNRSMWGGNSSELDDLLKDGVHAFLGRDSDDCADKINFLMSSKTTRQKISKKAREIATKIWGRHTICKQWKRFFEKLGLVI